MSGRARRWWAQLRGVQPALEESEITRERLALEEAIRKVEAEAARQARERRCGRPCRGEPSRRARICRARRRDRRPRRIRGRLRTVAPRPAEGAPPQQRTAARQPAQPAGPGAQEIPRSPADTRRTHAGPVPGQRRPDLPVSGRMQPRDAGEQILPQRHRCHRPRRRRNIARQSRPSRMNRPRRSAMPLEDYGQLEPQMEPENLWALPLDSTPAEPPVDLDAQSPPPERMAPRYDAGGAPAGAAAAALLRRSDTPRPRAGAAAGDWRAGGLAAHHHRQCRDQRRGDVPFVAERAAEGGGRSGAAEDHRPHRPAVTGAVERAAGGAARRALRGGAGRSAGQALRRHRAVEDRDAAGDARTAARACGPRRRRGA